MNNSKQNDNSFIVGGAPGSKHSSKTNPQASVGYKNY